jgi:hypothetical protein
MNDHSEYDYDLTPGKFNLETGSKTDFITSLEDSNSKNVISQFLLEVNNPTTIINVLTDNLNNTFINAANKTFHFKQFTKCFNVNCHFFKRELNNIGKKLKHPDNCYLRTSFHRLRKEYNQLLKKIKYDFFKSIVDELDSLHENDPKLFWQTIDKLRKDKHIQYQTGLHI